MKMFEKAGHLQLAWKPGTRMMIQYKGGAADILLALANGIKDVIESTVPSERRIDCAQELAGLLLDMMQMPVTKIDLGAMKGGASNDTV